MKIPLYTLLVAAVVGFGTGGLSLADENETERVLESLGAAGIDTSMLSFAVRDGVVTVTGTVEDLIARERVVDALENTAGITEVRDNMETSD